MKKYIKPILSKYVLKIEHPIALVSNFNNEEGGEDQFSKRSDRIIIDDDEE